MASVALPGCGTTQMQQYRVYLLNADSHVQRVREIECFTDDAVLAYGAEQSRYPAAEAWQGARYIGRVPTGYAAAPEWGPC